MTDWHKNWENFFPDSCEKKYTHKNIFDRCIFKMSTLSSISQEQNEISKSVRFKISKSIRFYG